MISKKMIPTFKGTTLLSLVLWGIAPFLLTGCAAVNISVSDRPLPGMEPLNTYFMSQKVFTLGERFVIKDKTDTPVFYIKGKALSIVNELTLRDTDGNELTYIKEKAFHIGEFYKIYREGRLLAKVKKKFIAFKDKFIVSIPGLDDYKVTGSFGRHNYKFSRNGKDVAFVTKKFLSVGDKYRIEIVPGEDDVLILSVVVIIDMVCHNGDETGIVITQRH